MCDKNTTVDEMDKVTDVQKERTLKNFSRSMCTGTNTMDTPSHAKVPFSLIRQIR